MSSATDPHTQQPSEEASTPSAHNPVVTWVLFIVVFGLFIAGLWVMSLYTIAWFLFVIGLLMCILSLFLAFQAIPALLR
ncbi:hypothetical protein Bra3105_04195 [Brachybacterium halotolerans subsp. kimchii]|uniref:hypothetical protein n=1 Tax=Brachybacterium halotolerans TaxID=2795215 RepID=UPI001E30996D|nr:hypothetical protein [Brachybacterium halotolerans]UEJ83522.1 hypothetical protein Bra3105_04195 [Brachybacterium halotolerans subsp. kimchii]